MDHADDERAQGPRLEAELVRLQTPRTARVFVAGGAGATDYWLLLHGYGQTADEFLAAFAPLANERRRLIAPEALSRHYRRGGGGEVGASWMTRVAREDEITDTIAYLDRVITEVLPNGHQPRLHVLGFSQGGSAAARWCALGSSAPPASLVLWCSDVPPELPWSQLRDRFARIETTVVAARLDHWLDEDKLGEVLARLEECRAKPNLHRIDGGHEVPPEAASRVIETVERDARRER